jgi:Domain of unknown function (DUF5666)
MTSTLKRTRLLPLMVAVLAMALFGALAATQAQAALKHFDGVVVSKNSDTRTFTIKTESGNPVRFQVNNSTKFERIPGGFAGLDRGLRVEVDAASTSNGLLAKLVEKHRAGGGGGGGGGADDGPKSETKSSQGPARGAEPLCAILARSRRPASSGLERS